MFSEERIIRSLNYVNRGLSELIQPQKLILLEQMMTDPDKDPDKDLFNSRSSNFSSFVLLLSLQEVLSTPGFSITAF